MRARQSVVCVIVGALGLLSRLAAQSPKPQPDVLLLNDDERIVGHFVRSNGGSLTFHSEMLGDLNIDWKKVKELHSGGQYVVIGKDVRLGRRTDISHTPKGTVDATAQTVNVTPSPGAAPVTVPVADAAHILEQSEFQQALREPGFFEGWNGAITAGATIVQATQQSRTFTGAINLVRAIPTENWMAPRNRTSLNLVGTEGFQVQPGTQKIKTGILHADAERDEYFSGSRVFGFGQAAFDHNFSQGLDLAQQYGGGVGWTAVKNAANILDLKGGVSYLNQQFHDSTQNQKLIASTFSEEYTRKLKRGVAFIEQISATPTWNNTSAWLAAASSSFTAPVYKRLNFNVSLLDNYLHNPSPGFRKNSFQATTGLTYTLR